MVSWETVAKSVFQRYMPNTERNVETVEAFTSLWQELAIEFSNKDHINEYNSIKHGFRVRSGGFALSIGLEQEYGVPPPSKEMQLVGKSDFGSTIFNIETIGDAKGNRNIRSRRASINWSIVSVN